jgi:hypothetical protein
MIEGGNRLFRSSATAILEVLEVPSILHLRVIPESKGRVSLKRCEVLAFLHGDQTNKCIPSQVRSCLVITQLEHRFDCHCFPSVFLSRAQPLWFSTVTFYFLSVSASTPGSFLPSRNSSEAPPPVEMCVILSATPEAFTAATESPPPTIDTAPGLSATA